MKMRTWVAAVVLTCVVGVWTASAEGTNSQGNASGDEKKGPGRFQAMDTNADGILSLDEFKAMHADRQAKMKEKLGDKYEEVAAKMPTAEVRFAELDTDKSGGITKEEMKAGHKNRRQKGKQDGDAKDDGETEPKE